jgi:hypothetical protein
VIASKDAVLVVIVFSVVVEMSYRKRLVPFVCYQQVTPTYDDYYHCLLLWNVTQGFAWVAYWSKIAKKRKKGSKQFDDWQGFVDVLEDSKIERPDEEAAAVVVVAAADCTWTETAVLNSVTITIDEDEEGTWKGLAIGWHRIEMFQHE